MDTDSDDEPRSPPRDTDTDDSSDDESPQTGANVWRAGTYGTVVAKLDGGKVEVQWEGGDTSTLDADVYAAALRSYAKSPRARGENDATSSSSDDDDDKVKRACKDVSQKKLEKAYFPDLCIE